LLLEKTAGAVLGPVERVRSARRLARRVEKALGQGLISVSKATKLVQLVKGRRELEFQPRWSSEGPPGTSARAAGAVGGGASHPAQGGGGAAGPLRCPPRRHLPAHQPRDGGEGPDARRGRASGPRLVLLAALGHRGGAPGVGGRASKAMHCQAPEDTPLAAAGRRDGRPVPAGQRIGAKAKTLFRPQTYFRIPTEDRLWIPEEYVALFVEKGWRRGNQGELAR
jgi:hypothetical protein